MKVAITTWNGRISPVFDVARQVLLLDVEDGRVIARREEPLPGDEMQHQAAQLVELGTYVLICGAISHPMAAVLAGKGIRVIPFTAGAVEEVVAAWLAGSLPSAVMSMPGCCGQQKRRHGRTDGGGRAGRPWACKQEEA